MQFIKGNLYVLEVRGGEQIYEHLAGKMFHRTAKALAKYTPVMKQFMDAQHFRLGGCAALSIYPSSTTKFIRALPLGKLTLRR